MNFDWDKLWITICLGIVTISSAPVGAAFFSAGLLDLTTPQLNTPGLVWLWCKSTAVLFVVAIHWYMLSRSETAMFATDFELARMGTNRRLAVRHIFNGLFFVIFGLLLIVAMNAIEELGNSLISISMAPATGD